MSTSNVGGGNSSGGGGSSLGGGGGGGPCGACKFLRRKCVSGCIFAPYFDSEHGASHFAAVHKVFGASNVSKLLLHIPAHKRLDAVVTICYEAEARLSDPVFGCVAHIFALQSHLATLELPFPPPPPPPVSLQASFSISDLPTTVTNLPSALDLSVLFDPIMVRPHWALQQQEQPVEIRQQLGVGSRGDLAESSSSSGGIGSSGGWDLQELARELLDSHRTGQPDHHYHQPPCTK